jgi:hypothetical protein
MVKLHAPLITVVLLLGSYCVPLHADPAADQAYVTKFLENHPPVDPVPSFSEYASAERYDQLYMGADLDRSLEDVNNQRGRIAWRLAYRMASLNEMARATRDPKYLAANLRVIRGVLAARDDRTGLKIYDGRVVPAWSSDGYRKGEQALFMVHTGMIVYPMLDAVLVARSLEGAGDDLRRDLEATVPAALESMGCHDDAWRDGPGADEGHYAMVGEEAASEGKPQPGNRLSAMGRALWCAYRVTGDAKHRDRALAMGRYIKRRLPVTDDGAYRWGYWLSVEPWSTTRPAVAAPEDTSHASLTMSFPLMLANDGEVFTPEDMQRFGKAVVHGIARLDNGVLFGDVGGRPASRPDLLGHPANWLQLAPHTPEVRDRIVPFYLRYKPTPLPSELAYLIRFGTPQK